MNNMFKRRSSKDLSTKVGYDHLNSKPTKKLDHSRSTTSTSTLAPVSNVSAPNLDHNVASSSSSLKTTASTSPHVAGEPPTTAGASPLAPLKNALPPVAADPAAVASASAGGVLPDGNGIKASAGSRSSSNGAVSAQKSMKSSPALPKMPVEPPPRNLFIGEGVLFEGATEGCVAAVVGGRLKGKVKSRRLEITRVGKMEGTALCETAEIAGLFEGNLTATKALKICSTGRFRGDVSFGSIVVENGGKLEGRVNFEGLRAPLSEATSTSSAPKRTSSTAPAAPAAAPVEIAKKDVDDESSPSPNPTLLESPPPSMTTASESTAPELDPTTASPEPEATASEPGQETSTKSEPAPSVATTPAEAPQGEGEGEAPTVSQASQPTAEESSPE